MATRPSEELITDRTLADIKNETAKGNYSAADLNRIEKWERYLADLLDEYGYHINIETKIDWQVGFGRENMFSNITRIKNNLSKLREGFIIKSTTPEVPSISDDSINYIKANNIEKIMVDIESIIAIMEQGFRYTNFLYAGMDLDLPNIINEEV